MIQVLRSMIRTAPPWARMTTGRMTSASSISCKTRSHHWTMRKLQRSCICVGANRQMQDRCSFRIVQWCDLVLHEIEDAEVIRPVVIRAQGGAVLIIDRKTWIIQGVTDSRRAQRG